MKEISFDKIKKLSRSTWIISLLYSVFWVFGKYAINEVHIDFTDWKVYLLIFLVFLPINLICVFLYALLDSRENQEKKEATTLLKTTKIYFLVFGIIILFWIPQWISLFPGCFNYDALEIMMQFVNHKFVAQYPPFFSIILVGFMVSSYGITNSYVLGIAAYTVLQMLISATVFTYSIYLLDKYKISNKIKYFAIGYYSIFPAVYLYVLSFTKDSLFTIFFYLSALLYLELFREKDEFFKNNRWILLIISNLLAILLRRNAIYVFAIFAVIFVFSNFLKSKNKGKIIVISIIPIVAFFAVNGLLNRFLNVEPEDSLGGMLSVPIQQIAYSYRYNPESFTAEEKSKIFYVADEKLIQEFYPEVSDSIIYYIEKDKIFDNKTEYFDIWLKLGLKNISNYINAWIRLDYGYFYPDAVQKVYIKGDSFEERSFFENWFIIGGFSKQFNMLESLKTVNIAFANGVIQKIPVIKYICSIGAFLWIFMFSISYTIYKKRKNFRSISMLIGLLLLTYILGPLVMVRYFLILFYAFPIIIAACLEGEKL